MARLEPQTNVEISPKRIQRLLQPPDSFAYSGDNKKMFETWTIGPMIDHRDAGILDKANCKALKQYLESDPSLEGEYEIIGASHWAVGWVDHLTYRVLDKDGKPTRIALLMEEWFDHLAEVYPIADESIYSEMEYNATIKNIANHFQCNKLRDDIPDDWAEQMFSWFWRNDQGAVENSDDQGGYPEDGQFEAAARALGFWEENED